jgi:Bacterial Peptidase A24 N-terminal domain/Type IV leader peptidase family
MTYERMFEVVAFVLGACVGSFLNVCIYRLPLNLSVNQPRRSFCPSCKSQIPWHQNLPIFSWLLLRGRCARCGARIAFRYPAVELLTALFFLIIWKSFPWQIAIAYWVFIALVIAATFIDFAHFIIPDEITIGGTVAGLLASIAVPRLMYTDRRPIALLASVASAALGYALLWLVLEGDWKNPPRLPGHATETTPILSSVMRKVYGAISSPAKRINSCCIARPPKSAIANFLMLFCAFVTIVSRQAPRRSSSIISMKSAEQLTRSRFRAKPWAGAI